MHTILDVVRVMPAAFTTSVCLSVARAARPFFLPLRALGFSWTPNCNENESEID